MLRLVIGTAGTGKSTYINEKIIETAKNGQKCLLLVPEQFSKTGESLLFSRLDDTRANLVQLFTFTSLLNEARTETAGLSVVPLTAAGKAVMAHRAMMNLKKQLTVYSRQVNSFNFSYVMTGTFDDLKRSGYDSAKFYKTVEKTAGESPKLKELSLIYAEYAGLMGDKFIDSEDLLTLLAENMPARYTEEMNIFIDGFESFSRGQMAVIERFLTDSQSVTVALTADGETDKTGGVGCFSFVQKTIRELKNLAKQVNVTVERPVLMENSVRFLNKDLRSVDLFVQGKGGGLVVNGGVEMRKFDTQSREVNFAVAHIGKMIREKGYTYNDIAIVCPQLDKYENRLQESLTLAGMPYFIDENRIISSSSPMVLFKTVIEIISRGLTAENFIKLLKSGLTKFADDDIIELENYLFVWRDYEFDFSKDFTLSPGGLKPEPTESEKELLVKLNALRREVYDIFSSFGSGQSSKLAADILKNCYRRVMALGAEDKVRGLAAQMPTTQSDLLIRQWKAAVDCLDRLYDIMGDDVVSQEDLRELFSLIAEGVQIGFAPETQDCLMISRPKRMKLNAVKAVYILGAAEGFFPAAATEPGLLNAYDRENLKINLNSDFKNQFAFENLYYYKALTTAREYMFISSCRKNIDILQKMSSRAENMAAVLQIPTPVLKIEDYRVTREFFADSLSLLADNSSRESRKKLLEDIGANVEISQEHRFAVEDLEYLASVLGDIIEITPTHVENYYKCPFMYFLNGVLRVRPLEKAEFGRRIAGDYMHFIAQRVLEKYGRDYPLQPWENIEKDIDRAVKEFLEKNYPREIYNNVKFTSQYRNMRENAGRFMKYIYFEQASSSFKPIAYELRIGGKGKVPPLTVTTERGNRVNIAGICDRVDVYRGEEKDYLRVVDYKTGSRNFSLDRIYNGLSMQMLIYMYVLIRQQFAKKDNPVFPGGVVYQHSDADAYFDKSETEAKLYMADGMALAEEEICRAFDKSEKGEYGVIKNDKGKIKKLPGSEAVSREKFGAVLEYVKDAVQKMGDGIYGGTFDDMPLAEKREDTGIACKYCNYKSVCLNTNKKKVMEKRQFDREEKNG